MATATVKGGDISKRRTNKAVVHKKVAKIHETASIPRRKYNDFAGALRDADERRITRLDINIFAEEIKREALQQAK